MQSTHSPTGRWPDQRETALFDDTYQLPAPQTTELATLRDVGAGGPSAGPPAPRRQGSAPASAWHPRNVAEWLLLVLWHQKWLVLAVMVAGLIGAWVYMKAATPVYAGQARLYVQPAAALLGQSAGIAEQPATSKNFLWTQKELITSQGVLDIALAKLRRNKTLEDAPTTESALRDVLATDVDRSNDILSVTAYAPNPKDAEVIANAMVDAYMAYQTKPKATNTNDAIRELDEKRRDADMRLKTASESVAGLESKYGTIAQKDERAAQFKIRLDGLNESIVRSRNEAVEAKTLLDTAAKAMGINPDDLLKQATNPDDGADADASLIDFSAAAQAQLRSELLNIQAQLHELQQRYLPNHPYVAALKKRLHEKNLDYLLMLQRRCYAAERGREEFQKLYNEEQTRALAMGQDSTEYKHLLDDVDRLKKERDGYTGRIREIELARDAGGLTIDVVNMAKADTTPAWPSFPWVGSTALGISFVLGMLLATMREKLDDRFRSATDMKSSLGLPVLAVIPQSTTKRSPSVSGQRILLDPASDAAEAYRSLRTAVQFAAPDGQTRTVVVTSPSSGDGKTTLASNLAIAMAQAGKKVCLVDCDLRRPMQHEIFGTKNNTGLSMLLAGRCSLETALQRGGVPGLEILPCGPLPANPTEILNSREFGDLLEQLADKYDHVVIDTPPVQSVNDTRIIAALCDATLIVLKAPNAHRRQVEQTRDSLLSVGARVIGLVVNDVPRRPQSTYGRPAASRRVVAGLTSQDYDILQARAK
jgi:capsular exopolysaccharide synthesis family protein